jgi:hypothetical protein
MSVRIDDERRDETTAALDQMTEAGADLAQARDVDFYLYFPSRPAAEAAAHEVTGHGFLVAVPETEGDGLWLLPARTSLVVSVDELHATEATLAMIALRHGGEYDGWDAPVEP